MRYILVLFIVSLLSANSNYELQLYEKVLPVIFKKDKLKVYVDESTKDILRDSYYFTIVDDCTYADILIGSDFKNLAYSCRYKPIFTTSYKSFKNFPNSFGAFYWRKGRPQIRFKKDVLKRYDIVLPNSLQKYIK